jgi:hypothetical protein
MNLFQSLFRRRRPVPDTELNALRNQAITARAERIKAQRELETTFKQFSNALDFELYLSELRTVMLDDKTAAGEKPDRGREECD